jgi:hypothetical protein
MPLTRYDVDCRLLRKQLLRIHKLQQDTTEYYAALLFLNKSCSAIDTPTNREANTDHTAACQFLLHPEIRERLSAAAEHIKTIVRQKDKKEIEKANAIRRQVRVEYRNSRRTGTGYGQIQSKVSGGLPDTSR